MELAPVTDAELLSLAQRSWTSMASIVGQEMEGGKVGYKSTHDQNPHVTPPFNKALTYCRDFPPLAGERRGNADQHHTKVNG